MTSDQGMQIALAIIFVGCAIMILSTIYSKASLAGAEVVHATGLLIGTIGAAIAAFIIIGLL